MKLDRNINAGGRGKYGLVLNRKVERVDEDYDAYRANVIRTALRVLELAGIIDWGTTPETEFFVMRLKDEYAAGGLSGYAAAAAGHDTDYAREVWDLSQRSGRHHPNCKKPD